MFKIFKKLFHKGGDAFETRNTADMVFTHNCAARIRPSRKASFIFEDKLFVVD